MLTNAQVQGFERDGYVAPIDVLDATEVDQLRERLEALRAGIGDLEGELYEVEAAWIDDPSRVVFHFLGAWMVDAWFHDLAFHPAVTVPSAQLLGVDRLRFWHDQVFYKPPRHPGVVPWHQDYSYWQRVGPARHITVNLVLDDTDLDNGCLHFVPGSHRWELLPTVPFDAPMDAVREFVPEERRAAFDAPVAVPLRAGQASIHHSHTLHGSGPNRSDRPRRAVVINTMADDTVVLDGSEPILKGVDLPTGALVEGDHFPIVLEADD